MQTQPVGSSTSFILKLPQASLMGTIIIVIIIIIIMISLMEIIEVL
jgi:hypothetical protein